jgi:antitoxin VapB
MFSNDRPQAVRIPKPLSKTPATSSGCPAFASKIGKWKGRFRGITALPAIHLPSPSAAHGSPNHDGKTTARLRQAASGATPPLSGLVLDPLPPPWYIPDMTTTLFSNGRSQAVRIPKELRFEGREVSIRRLGDGVLLVPVKASTWPEGFFESIRIEDDHFTRPDQGELPPIVEFTG